MALSYNRMWKLLVDKKMSKADLRKAADIAPNTMTKLRRDEAVNLAIKDDVNLILGPLMSDEVSAAGDRALNNNIPLISLACSTSNP